VAEVWPNGLDAGVRPRLLSVQAAARYLGRSPWSVRAWLASGELVAVRLPGTKGGAGARRRLLIDVRDLDTLIEVSKGGADSTRSPA
jgi:hypothetical protein